MTTGLIILSLFGVLGFLLQGSLGLLIALRRPLSPLQALSIPLLLLFAGACYAAWSAEQSYTLALLSLDDPKLSHIMLEIRPETWEGWRIGGFSALIDTFPILLGSAIAALRARDTVLGPRRPWMPAVITALAAFPGPIVLLIGLFATQDWLILGPAALLLPLLLLPALVAMTAPPSRAIGALALTTSLFALLTASSALIEQSLPDDPDTLQSALLHRFDMIPSLNLGIFGAALAILMGWSAVGRAPGPRQTTRMVTGVVGINVLIALIALPTAWFAYRHILIGRMAGMYELTIAQVANDIHAPLPAPNDLPGRILVASATRPRWLSRSPEGLQSEPITGELLDIGSSFQRGDGLILPLTLSLEDSYLILSGATVGEIALVGCAPIHTHLLRYAARDPLLSSGWCGSRTLHLRLGLSDPPQRSLILLKDAQVDDDGNVININTLPEDPRPTLIRAQVDAKISDLHALLGKIKGTPYLGYGVQLDGSDLPIGINPH